MLFLLFLPLQVGSFLFPSSGGGCCSSPCPPPPVCQSTPVCPPIQPCPSPAQSCCPTCSCSKRAKREVVAPLSNGTFIVSQDVFAPEPMTSLRLKRDVLDDVVKIDAKCNSEELREIIIQNMDRVTSVAKKRIQTEAEARLDGRYNVICARGDFSYITNTERFCQETVGDVTCYVFKQLSDIIRRRLK